MRKKLVIIIGFGGHAKVLLDILKKNLFKIIGFVEKKILNLFTSTPTILKLQMEIEIKF